MAMFDLVYGGWQDNGSNKKKKQKKGFRSIQESTSHNFFRLGSAISPSASAEPSLKKLWEVQTQL